MYDRLGHIDTTEHQEHTVSITIPQTITVDGVPITAENFVPWLAEEDTAGAWRVSSLLMGQRIAQYVAHYRDGAGGRTPIHIRYDKLVLAPVTYRYKVVTAAYDHTTGGWTDEQTDTIAVADFDIETAYAWLTATPILTSTPAPPAAPAEEPTKVEVTFAIHESRSFAASVRIDPAAFAAYVGVSLTDAPDEEIAAYIRDHRLTHTLVDGGTEETWEDFTVVS